MCVCVCVCVHCIMCMLYNVYSGYLRLILNIKITQDAILALSGICLLSKLEQEIINGIKLFIKHIVSSFCFLFVVVIH